MKLEFVTNKSLPRVFEYLTDMEKFVSVHPIIYKMDDLGENNFRVYEKLKLLYIPCVFKYNARVTGYDKGDQITMNAAVIGMIKIEMNFYLKDMGNSTAVTEEVNFKSLLPVKPLMKKIFREQHRELFKNIDKAAD